VPSGTDSGSVGALISIVMSSPFEERPLSGSII
jgi:hypothetical protein